MFDNDASQRFDHLDLIRLPYFCENSLSALNVGNATAHEFSHDVSSLLSQSHAHQYDLLELVAKTSRAIQVPCESTTLYTPFLILVTFTFSVFLFCLMMLIYEGNVQIKSNKCKKVLKFYFELKSLN